MTEIEHQGTIAMSAPEHLSYDIADRLRRYRPRDEFGDPVKHTICDEAAAEIERLRTPPPQDRLQGALTKINDIRNSIIGCQTVNWSEHIYPLVAALEEAGFEGAGYPASRANVGTMLERTLAAENEASSFRAALQEHVDACDSDDCEMCHRHRGLLAAKSEGSTDEH